MSKTPKCKPIKTFYTYLNIADPFVAWETYRGILISPDCYQIEEHPSISFWMLRYLRNMLSPQAINELKLEVIRQKYYAHEVSRFRGFYYFENKTTAINAAKMWQLKYFNNFCLTDVGIDSKAIYSKLDSNWITLYAGKESDNDNWIHSYWRGEPCPGFDEPLWELLVIARGIIYNNELRMQAYENIKNSNPTTILPLLEEARIAAYLGSDLGHCSPYIIKKSETKYQVVDIMDMKDAENPIYLHKKNDYLSNPINHENINFNDLLLINDYNKFSKLNTTNRNFEFVINNDIANDFNIYKMSHNY